MNFAREEEMDAIAQSFEAYTPEQEEGMRDARTFAGNEFRRGFCEKKRCTDAEILRLPLMPAHALWGGRRSRLCPLKGNLMIHVVISC
ncbi:hypothetical protein SAMN04487895_10247 [Paenibacillus sophorae]|uniref:Uncharacterized protein n=1 Tax=Paenibacillus sophorae TaxID=1333845 RepID=A0A1H8I2I6_9BACL|nr:hypothetical protein SAMN04487895_10247 [Paenibacillus sophorae]